MTPEAVARRAQRLRERQHATDPPENTPLGYIKCTNCPRWQDPSQFVGKKGDVVRRCMKCRLNDDKKKKKPETREKHKERMRATRPDIKYRGAKREADERGFLRRNADVMKAYRSQPEKWKMIKYNQDRSLAYRIYTVKAGAINRGHIFALDDTTVEAMVVSSCWYCGAAPKIKFNGIDRKDNMVGYVTDNCVPCCATCNYMKKCLDPTTFVERCKHIAGDGSFVDAWPPGDGDIACTFCALPSNGVTRIDVTKGYSADNLVACCKECNQMKTNTKVTRDGFVSKAREVSMNWKEPPESARRSAQCIVRRGGGCEDDSEDSEDGK
jgi:hypothetical protein